MDGQIFLAEYTGDDSQKFYFKNLGNGFYSIKNDINKGLSVKSGGSTEGGQVVLNSTSNLAEQKWFIAGNPNGSYSLISLYNSLALDVLDGVANSGNIIRMWENNYLPAQQFLLEKID